MSLLWPAALLLLVMLPLLVAAYIWMLRRRKRFAVRYSSLSLVRAAMPRYSWVRRHLPFALLVVALASLVLALARPLSVVAVPTGNTVIVLAIDVSRSMLASDIPPTRIAAAQEAAISFIANQKPGTKIGLVAFAGFAETIIAPTDDRAALEAAVRSLTTGRGTNIGDGVLRSIDVISAVDTSVASSVDPYSDDAQPEPVPEGVFVPNIVVVLTDGVSTTGPLPVDAAQQAADRGVRVYTIGYGTENGGLFGGGPYSSDSRDAGFRRSIDEDTLQQVAELTDGEYYIAESASELDDVFASLPISLAVRNEALEVSVGFVAVGAVLAALAVFLSMRWNPFP